MKRESIEKYEEIFRKDPNSQVFAALADAYRELGLIEQAEKIARHGVGRHPNYVSGFVSLGRILVGKELWKDAETVLLRAASLAPENILAHQLLGQVYLHQKRPKDALKAYKLVLFLNPQSEKARKAVEKLESLTADEYDEDVFEMKKLDADEKKKSPATFGKFEEKSLERTLSLIDAYIVRNELSRAKNLLLQSRQEFPGEAALESRWALLGIEKNGVDVPFEEATALRPDLNREAYIRDRKLQRLESVLQRIKQLNP